MLSFLYETETEPYQWVLPGSQAASIEGFAATRQSPRDFDPGFFNTNSTLILGSREGPSAALWEFHIDSSSFSDAQSGYLVVACERVHGGLHTKEYGKAAQILFNQRQKDYIRLKAVADQHIDYFHRPIVPDLPKLWPISFCATVYAWPLNKEDFVPGQSQTVAINLDSRVLWDIDYVGVVINRSKRKLREGVKEVIFLILGAILGAVASLLTGR
jgi:hypothetical protein